MTTRFCPGCQSEVEDTGGFCLLGHRLALKAPVASLSALREEVDRSFEDSELAEVAFDDELEESWGRLTEPVMAGAVVAPPAPPAPPAPRTAPPPPPPSAAPAAAPVASAAPATVPGTPTRHVPAGPEPGVPASPASSPAPGVRVPPPPPPPAEKVAAPSLVPAGNPVPPPPPPASDRAFAAAIPPFPSVLPPNPASPVAKEDNLAGDPITAFAPAPRMDWGPEKGRFKRLGRRSRRSEELE